MNNRTRMLASFFSVAMAAMLLGAVVTHHVNPETALARSPEAAPPPEQAAPGGPGLSGSALNLDTFRVIARSQTPGVVNINTSRVVRRDRSRDPLRDFFGDDMMDRFFGPQGPQGPQGRGQERQTQQSLGSGFVIDPSGYILTNRHVIEGADEISVTLGTQRFQIDRPYTAKLVGKDARTDVALLKIDTKEPLTVLKLGDSEKTEVGEWVMAVGNPFGLGGNSVTVGVVSYRGRNLPLGVRNTSVDMIQTDAAINPGNSGGPLINTRGEVIGINTMIITGGLQQSAGVGFAVPINVAKEILPQLRDKGKVVRGWLGVQIQPLTADLARSYRLKEARGAVVQEVTTGSPAEKAGLKAEDVIISADGRPIQDSSDLSSYIAAKSPGSTVRLKVLQNGSEREVPIVLGTFPEELNRADNGSDEEGGGAAQHGMTVRDLTPRMAEQLELPRNARGVVVMSVEAGSPAEEAGLRRGDVIVSVNGVTVDNVAAYEAALAKAKGDGVARLRVRRGENLSITVLPLD
ncbi:MAG TPA: Do family serine endopeptidase [Vicinamibacteria bacterium]